MLVLGGRAPAFRWGQGSLQEMDHVPFVAPLVKFAATPAATAEIPELLARAMRAAVTPHSGPAFLDFPLDHVFMEADAPDGERAAARAVARRRAPTPRELDRAAALLREAQRPVIMAGTGLYWGRGEEQLLALAERAAGARVPQRPRPRLRARRPRAVLLPRAQRRPRARPTWRW